MADPNLEDATVFEAAASAKEATAVVPEPRASSTSLNITVSKESVMARYALVDMDGIVVDVSDGVAPLTPPVGTKAVPDPADNVEKGWAYAGGIFIPPLRFEALIALLVQKSVISSAELAAAAAQAAAWEAGKS
jgi:hypothetical protein